MDKVKTLLKPKQNPQEQLRDWQRRLRQECRNIDRQTRDLQREMKNVHKAIKEAAKRNDLVSAKALAKEIVMSRKAVNRLHENKAQLNSISMHLGESVAIARTVGHISKSGEVMKLVNDLMKAPAMAATMMEFRKEMTNVTFFLRFDIHPKQRLPSRIIHLFFWLLVWLCSFQSYNKSSGTSWNCISNCDSELNLHNLVVAQAGVIEETVTESIDSALDSEDIEEETEEEVNKVLSELAAETTAQLPEAARKERTNLPAQAASTSLKEEAIAEAGDEDEELEALKARLAKVRS